MRALGVDFGRVRIGLACGESEHQIASPRQPITATGTLAKDATNLVALAHKEEVEVIVLGLPLHENDKAERIVRKLGAEIEKLGFRVSYADESMTSIEANTTMHEAGLTAAERKARVDSESACRILDRFFQEHHEEGA